MRAGSRLPSLARESWAGLTVLLSSVGGVGGGDGGSGGGIGGGGGGGVGGGGAGAQIPGVGAGVVFRGEASGGSPGWSGEVSPDMDVESLGVESGMD